MSSEVLCLVVPRNYCGGINVISGSINYLKAQNGKIQNRRNGLQKQKPYLAEAIDSHQAILMSLFRAIGSPEPRIIWHGHHVANLTIFLTLHSEVSLISLNSLYFRY